MAFTGQDVDQSVTDALRDVWSTRRWGDEERLRHLNSGIVEIRRRRPYAAYIDGIITDAPAAVTDIAKPIALLDEFKEPLVAWICWHCLAKDSEDVANANKARMYAEKFAALL